MWERLRGLWANLFGPKKEITRKYEVSADSIDAPMRIGSTAQSSDEYDVYDIPADFDFRWFDILETLAHKKDYVSYAVENLMLANAAHHFYFSDSISTRNQKQMQAQIAKADYFNGGLEMLKKTLFRQLAVKGVICGEWYIDENKQLKFIPINPKEIRIRKINGKYEYYQYPSNSVKKGYEIKMGAGFMYLPLQRSDTSPYPVIPFLAALEHLDSQIEIVDGTKKAIKKMGTMGFLTSLVTEPLKGSNEDPRTYTQRCLDYLDKVAEQVKNNLKDGVTVGFKGKHEFQVVSNSSNASGASEVMKMFNHLLFAGLKQDANLLGENYATTETFGNVILAKYARQLEELQKVVAQCLEYGVLLDLIVNGLSPIYVKCEFGKVMTSDAKKDEEVRGQKIQNNKILFELGILSLQQFANDMGYDKPFLDKPLLPTTTPASAQQAQSEFDYAIPKDCNEEFEFKDKKMNQFAQIYLAEATKLYQSAVSKAMKAVKAKAGEKFTDANAFAQSIVTTLTENWLEDFKKPLGKTVSKQITKIYTHFRSDKKALENNTMPFDDKIPDSVFNQLDKRLQEYLKSVDNLYLGKFITDPDTTKRFIDFLLKYYAENDGQIGEGDTIEAFINEFEAKVNYEGWKIARIVSTTLNRTRNYATVLYMQQADIESYEILEVGDRLTCAYCKHLDGMTFSVADTVSKIEKEVEAGAENLPTLSPFVTTQSIDEFKKLSNTAMKGLGFVSPPFHANCRGMIVRV